MESLEIDLLFAETFALIQFHIEQYHCRVAMQPHCLFQTSEGRKKERIFTLECNTWLKPH